MPGRHSLLWKLVAVLGLFCLLMVSLHVDLGRRLIEATSYLSDSSKAQLTAYAAEAERAWRHGGAVELDGFVDRLQAREHVWVVVVDEVQRSLTSRPLEASERLRLSFVRQLDQSVGRPGGQPTFYVPFQQGGGRLVLDLPTRLNPRQHLDVWEVLLQQVLPAALAALLGLLLYRVFIAPLVLLRRQANRLSGGDLSARAEPAVAQRRDELGELARALDHMAGRLEGTVSYQQRLLRDLSHELRTPLARLRVACERDDEEAQALRARLEREICIMQRLVDNSLELAWLDAERPRFACEPIRIVQLWDMLAEDACFETGWDRQRLVCRVGEHCVVNANLSSLAQALENLLRNAIRHSPPGGCIYLEGVRKDADWYLLLRDEGRGIQAADVERIFEPFARLDSARPGDGGFGLGLSIARSAIALQNGCLWAEAIEGQGLRMHIRLPGIEPSGQFV